MGVMGVVADRWHTAEQDTPQQPIGDDGLRGAIVGKFVLLTGPCGAQHMLSFENARKLRDWLDRQPEISGHAIVDVVDYVAITKEIA